MNTRRQPMDPATQIKTKQARFTFQTRWVDMEKDEDFAEIPISTPRRKVYAID